MKMLITLFSALVVGLAGGCSKTATGAAGSETKPQHEHKPPHGGTPVELGEEENHLELVLDAGEGKLRAYILDGELENFVRITAPTLEIVTRLSGREEKLTLQPVANRATGETAGDTSLFEVQADWLRTTPSFDAVLTEIVIHGKSYANVLFNYPKGRDENTAR